MFGAKLLSQVDVFVILSSDIPLDFHKSLLSVPLRELRCLLVDINAK